VLKENAPRVSECDTAFAERVLNAGVWCVQDGVRVPQTLEKVEPIEAEAGAAGTPSRASNGSGPSRPARIAMFAPIGRWPSEYLNESGP
jgi:hypothetical protein